jgi:hypothetical protein
MTVHVVAVMRNKSIATMTMLSMMRIQAECTGHVDFHFVEDKTGLPKLIKTGERIIWFDYGVNLDDKSIKKSLMPFEHGLHVLVFPAVLEGINWERFKRGVDPTCQRGLMFDTEVGRKLGGDLYESVKTAARVWAMDAKPVDRKIRGFKLPLDSNEALFRRFAELDIKVGACSTAAVTCLYVHESIGNILTSSGLKVSNR